MANADTEKMRQIEGLRWSFNFIFKLKEEIAANPSFGEVIFSYLGNVGATEEQFNEFTEVFNTIEAQCQALDTTLDQLLLMLPYPVDEPPAPADGNDPWPGF